MMTLRTCISSFGHSLNTSSHCLKLYIFTCMLADDLESRYLQSKILKETKGRNISTSTFSECEPHKYFQKPQTIRITINQI